MESRIANDSVLKTVDLLVTKSEMTMTTVKKRPLGTKDSMNREPIKLTMTGYSQG